MLIRTPGTTYCRKGKRRPTSGSLPNGVIMSQRRHWGCSIWCWSLILLVFVLFDCIGHLSNGVRITELALMRHYPIHTSTTPGCVTTLVCVPVVTITKTQINKMTEWSEISVQIQSQIAQNPYRQLSTILSQKCQKQKVRLAFFFCHSILICKGYELSHHRIDCKG